MTPQPVLVPDPAPAAQAEETGGKPIPEDVRAARNEARKAAHAN